MLPLTLLTSAALAATLDVPTSYGTVQAAVDAATSGDIILVAPGTYGESVSVYKGGLTIQGDGPGVVIGPGPFGFALSHTAGDLLVQDVTLDGGGTHLAVLSSSSGHLTLERAVMRNGNTLYGGGLYSTGNDVTVLDSEFHDNVAAYGGGFYYSGYGEVLVEGSRFLGNTAYQAYGYGAGVASMGHDLTIRRSTFCGNISTDTYGRAGGVYHGGYGSFDLEESVFVGNSAGYGGALFFVTSGDVVNNTFYSNDGRLSGGAVEVQIGTVLLLNNLFVGQLGPLYAVAEDWYTYSGFLAAGTGHNLYWDNGGLDTTAGYQPTDVTADPRLAYAVADCTRFDGHLTIGSPAIGAGDSAGVFDDIGAFEVTDADGDGVLSDADCNDADPSIFPGAPETIADGIDQDCDGTDTCYVDGDLDGARTTTTVTGVDASCTAPGEALASAPIDCDDTDATFSPLATEVPGDGLDQTCDGIEVCYVDGDADGVRTDATTFSTDLDCAGGGEAWATDPDGDCDDADAAV